MDKHFVSMSILLDRQRIERNGVREGKSDRVSYLRKEREKEGKEEQKEGKEEQKEGKEEWKWRRKRKRKRRERVEEAEEIDAMDMEGNIVIFYFLSGSLFR